MPINHLQTSPSKIIQNIFQQSSTIRPKISSKSTPNLYHLFHSFFEGKSPGRAPILCAKLAQQLIQKHTEFSSIFVSMFEGLLAPFWFDLACKIAPKTDP